MHLREITQENGASKAAAPQNGQIRLDEQVVSQDELERRREDKSVRIVEVGENSFKTLKHLR